MDQTAFFKLSYGLYIISTTFEGKDAGCVANTLHQVTSSPAQLAVTLNKDNYTEQLIEKSGRFAAVVLTEYCDMDTIKNFGFCSSRDNDKFEKCVYQRDTYHAQALFCKFSYPRELWIYYPLALIIYKAPSTIGLSC